MRKSSNVHHFFPDSPCYRAIWLRCDHIFMLSHICDNVGEVDDTMVAKSAAISSVVLKDFLYGRPSSSFDGSGERNLK